MRMRLLEIIKIESGNMNGVCPAAFQTDFSAFRYFLKTNVAQSVAELIQNSQKT